MKIATNDLGRYYLAKNVKDDCPFCGESSWGLPTSEDVDGDADDYVSQKVTPLVMRYDLVSTTTKKREQIFTVLPMMCNNCGFVRLQHWRTLTQWIKANPEQTEPESDGEGAEG